MSTYINKAYKVTSHLCFCGFINFCLLVCFTARGQYFRIQKTYDSANSIQKNAIISPVQKLKKLYALKNVIEISHEPIDSTYAQILFLIGINELNVTNDYKNTIKFTIESLKINLLAKKGSLKDATKNALQIAEYYRALNIYNKAILYYDTTLQLLSYSETHLPIVYVLYARLQKTNILFEEGDYQKSIEESIDGLKDVAKDTSYRLDFLNEQALGYFSQGQLKKSLEDIQQVKYLSKLSNLLNYLPAGLKTEALIYEKQKKFVKSDSLFQQAIEARIKIADNDAISWDYNDFGNFYLNSLKNYANAKYCYLKAVGYAKKNKNYLAVATAYLDLAEVYYKQQKFNDVIFYDNKVLEVLKINKEDILKNPSFQQLSLIGFKQLSVTVMTNRVALLLELNKKTNDAKYLVACLQTALVTDSLLTQTRHEQSEEESKILWRNETRNFYRRSLEACYLAQKPELAFFFLEKSRAVLLNDQLNKIAASVHLPASEEARQENFQIDITEQQQKLNSLKDTSKEYAAQQYKLLKAKDDFDHYIKSLEQKYPAYYQSKYADDVPSLKDLQNYLEANKQSFVHYFMGDTATYILAITSKSIKFIRLSKNDFDNTELIHFLQLCSDKELLNNHYDSFAKVSNYLYQQLFQPLQLPKGRVIICADNFLIPFEALCSDKNGRQFLLNDYAFSYVYSARYLMRQFENSKAKGNFLGIAPVHFASYLDVPDLKQADNALQASASHYHNSELLTHDEASHSNFMKLAANYTIVNVFSHAHADSTNEPSLYMQDSVIHLSELQSLIHPAAKLIVLSACQTNVGKNATGEGIYSLARGFAAAGIPAVAATLWKADDQTIYAISDKFHEYLSQGMPKDVALQKAKLYFIENNSSEKMLPYYWANMVLAGNAEPIKLSTNLNEWWWVAGSCAILASITLLMLRKKRR